MVLKQSVMQFSMTLQLNPDTGFITSEMHELNSSTLYLKKTMAKLEKYTTNT